jgi:hypothetical protein
VPAVAEPAEANRLGQCTRSLHLISFSLLRWWHSAPGIRRTLPRN